MSAPRGYGIPACTEADTPSPGSRHPPEQTLPREQTPLQEQTPQADTPLGADTPQPTPHPPEQTHTPPQSRPPGSRHTPPRSRYPPEQTPPQNRHTPPGSRLRNTVNERPVRILLECILVWCCSEKLHMYNWKTNPKVLFGSCLVRVADTLPHGCATDRSHHPKINTERYSSQFYYRPQRSCGKVMFSQASVILSTGGGVCGRHPLGIHPHPHPQADTPTLWADTPLGRQPPGQKPPCPVHAWIHPLPSACWDTPPAQCMLEYTPPCMLEYIPP